MKVVLLPLTLLGLLTVASADDIRTQIKTMGEAVDKAMMNRDIGAFSNAMKGVVTSDFKYFDNPTAKPMTYDQMVAEMKKGLGMMTKMTTVDSHILSVKTKGDNSTVVMSHMMVSKTAGPDKKEHVMTFTGTSIDMYHKVGGAWKFASMMWKTQATRVDGHLQKTGM